MSNKLIYIGVCGAVVFFSTLYFSTQDDPGKGKVQQHSPIAAPIVIDTVTGDSTADSYDSLQATVRNAEVKAEEVLEDNQYLSEQLKLLKNKFERFEAKQSREAEEAQRTGSVTFKKLNSQKYDELDKTKDETGLKFDLDGEPEEKKKEDLIKKIDEYKPKSTDTKPKSDFQFSDGYSLSDGLGFSNLNKKPQNQSSRTYGKNDPNNGWVVPIELEGKPKDDVKKLLTKKEKSKGPGIYPAMTISDNSILYDTTALTYIVGRIPVEGRVADPFPAKMIVGKEVLIANGHDLPGIEGMFFSGYATGDMNLRCVRAEMNSYTFVFDDGRQVSFRETPKTGSGAEEPMAYISDRFGLPCVMGSFVSNVAEFLSIQAGLSGLTAAGEAYSAAQVTTGVNSSGGSSSVVTGDSGKYAMGKVVSGAFSDISKWMLERQENSFDAVVVPSGTKVSLHINRDILIDYNEAARRVDYRYQVNSNSLD
jgi:integrating conjugative element protein (TIGR03752 family)